MVWRSSEIHFLISSGFLSCKARRPKRRNRRSSSHQRVDFGSFIATESVRGGVSEFGIDPSVVSMAGAGLRHVEVRNGEGFVMSTQ